MIFYHADIDGVYKKSKNHHTNMVMERIEVFLKNR
ncbi:hypothetical protein SAMN05192559_11025 [Halobacillus karajensis]|uniref:Uncharacterized protein n=1 Tax=Halobacillus karajensis TaxID=195088 RepID=A0A024PA96_9BACI|nr:hypothetical protein BN982_03793 [Halobacillus karajensis]CDQ25342.1 hypothetical protein BN983_03673 [Halobacillus karajensis]CDQ29666.1 hypothetical protein BN981_04087 [Halobacillus karajensis]SEI07307.1 hypothetical protein SAMN05192559_11025 [Halobacillus karajensis]